MCQWHVAQTHLHQLIFGYPEGCLTYTFCYIVADPGFLPSSPGGVNPICQGGVGE